MKQTYKKKHAVTPTNEQTNQKLTIENLTTQKQADRLFNQKRKTKQNKTTNKSGKLTCWEYLETLKCFL